MIEKFMFFACIAYSIAALAADPEIGTIVSAKHEPATKSDITVRYDYDGKGKLVLFIQNTSMNAAARGVTGSIAIKESNVLILPRERYDSRGPVDCLRWYMIQYAIQNVHPGRYFLVHDGSFAEGTDRIAKTELDFTIAGKGTKTVSFKEPDPSEDPFAEPSKKKTESGPGE